MSTFGLIDPSTIGTVERVADGVSMVHAFANVGVVHGGGAVLIVDTASAMFADLGVRLAREASSEPLGHIVYTHGHVDHVGGTGAFLASAEERGHARPEVWAHARVPARFQRYARTWAWNNEVNRRQFGFPAGARVFPETFVAPDHLYESTASLTLGSERIELHHAEAETDDATWVWLPERRTALAGDLVVGSMPNTGNPNKAQRHTLGWAEALEAIASRRPEHLVPGHGSPVHGDLAIELLMETARALRFLHDRVLERLNEGRWPDEIVDEGIELPADLRDKPYLQPLYGCAAFVVRDVLRAYAGWWGGNPAELLPAKRRDTARDLMELAGRDAMLGRARALLSAGHTRRALHLAVVMTQAEPGDPALRSLLAEVLEVLVNEEPSFIARNFYADLARRAREE